MKTKEPISIYIHIPFCVRKCLYCDFLSFKTDENSMDMYADAILRQIDGIDAINDVIESESITVDAYRVDAPVASVYIGGGTPSVFPGKYIEAILCKLKNKFYISEDAEITIEVNPGTVDTELLKFYRSLGINRLSMGLQSAQNEELKLLGRIHTYEEFLDSYKSAQAVGFENINVDIMTALPGQNEEMLSDTIGKVLDLNPSHISAYSLILEEGTPFYETYTDENMAKFLPGETLERKLYYLLRDKLVENGYRHYEISNFSKPGYESRHNCGYWQGRDYLGLGLGASSLLGGVRIKNVSVLDEYYKDPLKPEEVISLSKEDEMEEFMFLGLRMNEGVSSSSFRDRFNVDLMSIYSDVIKKLTEERLLERSSGRVFLTDLGRDYGNYVFSRFLL